MEINPRLSMSLFAQIRSAGMAFAHEVLAFAIAAGKEMLVQ